MQFYNPLDRRIFLKGAGAAFLSSVTSTSFADTQKSDVLFASAYRHQNGGFGVLIFDENGKSISNINLPDRGHDITFDKKSNWGVVFARRPGNFAMAFDIKNESEPYMFTAPEGRHFYGHGIFSSNSQLLYAAENNFNEGTGIIGIYDATNKFSRIGEFSSFGVGPHEILLHPTKPILIVANGGIETHPDFGRAKLNLATMQPSICFIDLDSGQLIEQHKLLGKFHKLSIRHMDVAENGQLVFGCQYEGEKSDIVPLIGSTSLGTEAKLWEMPHNKLESFENYVGSVSFSKDQKLIAVTLPKGNQIAILDVASGDIKETLIQDRSFGVIASKNNFLSTSETGVISSSKNDIKRVRPSIIFDNHIASYLTI